jgi:Uncharacterized protein conserved in bacteria (DUF2219)
MRLSILIGTMLIVLCSGTARAVEATSLQIDNDLFSGLQRDRDYSFGAAIAFATPRSNPFISAVDSTRDDLDDLLPTDGSPALRSTQAGLIAMTPDDLTLSLAQPDDRPYANLLYLTTSQLKLSEQQNRAHYSSFTVGMLGLGIGESLQKGIHQVVGGDDPQGWDHQISDGGEPTARFVHAEQWLLGANNLDITEGRQTKLTLSGSAGFLTEASAAVSTRFGRIHTPWWSFNPELADYSAAPIAPAAVSATSPNELYAFFGARLKVRAYNALLQGQFRSSDVRVASDDLARLQAEAWAGVASTWSDWRLSYTVRVASNEIDSGPAARSLVWASVNIERAF